MLFFFVFLFFVPYTNTKCGGGLCPFIPMVLPCPQKMEYKLKKVSTMYRTSDEI